MMKQSTGYFLAFIAVFSLAACGLGADSPDVRESILAGTWYAKSKSALTEQTDKFLKNVPPYPAKSNRVRALISPHAGYEWSGQPAAYAYKAVQGVKVKRVIVLAPTHRASFRGGSILDVEAYETPLGQVSLDKETCKRLLASPDINTHPEAHAAEHSLEIQLPFLQRVLGDFLLIPIVVGEISIEECSRIAGLIRPLLDKDTLLVMSSDFTHQGPRFRYQPFRSDVQTNIRRLDFSAVNHILNLDGRGFREFVESTRATICGRNPIRIGIAAIPLQTKVEFVRYETSGDRSNDFSETVSYCSILFREESEYLDEKETALLLEIARKTLVDTFDSGEAKEYEPPGSQITPRLQEKKGVFVTLHKNGRLRGCIGQLDATDTLHRTVTKTVLKSAFKDSRFNPLTKEEMNEIDIEISVMSPQKQVDSWKEILLGRDGIILMKNGRGALYLPQVALEQGWDVETALGHLSEKAGLKKDDWKKGCSFKTFTAQVFGETFKDRPKGTK